MTVGADSGVASILIPKTVQNGIRGCFISHPQKNSSKQFNLCGRMMVRVDSGVASILIPKTVQNGIRGLLHFSSPKKYFKTVHSKRN
jgi:hypothetical protein